MQAGHSFYPLKIEMSSVLCHLKISTWRSLPRSLIRLSRILLPNTKFQQFYYSHSCSVAIHRKHSLHTSPLILTSNEAAVVNLLQQLHPSVNFIDLLYCVLCCDHQSEDQSDLINQLNYFTVIAGELYGPILSWAP